MGQQFNGLIFSIALMMCYGLSNIQNDALKSLYDGLDGENWKPLCSSGWNFTGRNDPCRDHWYGLTCNSLNSSILNIELGNCDLVDHCNHTLGIFRI